MPSLKDDPSPRPTFHLSSKGGLRLQEPPKVTDRRGPQLTLLPPPQRPSKPPCKEMSIRKCLWTPLRCTPKTDLPSLRRWGDPRPFNDEGPDMPKSEGWKVDYSTFFRYFLRGHYPHIPMAQLRPDLRTGPQIPGDLPGVLGPTQGGRSLYS